MKEYTPEDYINYRLQRAREIIHEVEILIQNSLWNTAINRMYYACFYAVGALLIKNGMKAESHSGTRHLFGQHFVKTGIFDRQIAKHFTDLFEKRQKGDYNDFYDYDRETVERLFPLTRSFVDQIEAIIQHENK